MPVEFSLFSIIAIVLLFWFVWSQLKSSKTINVVATSIQEQVELGAKWSQATMIDTASKSNMSRAIELTEKLDELTQLNITKDSVSKIRDEWGI